MEQPTFTFFIWQQQITLWYNGTLQGKIESLKSFCGSKQLRQIFPAIRRSLTPRSDNNYESYFYDNSAFEAAQTNIQTIIAELMKEADRKAKEEEARKAKEEEARKAKEEEARKAQEADRKAKEEDRKAKEEKDRKAKEEKDRKANIKCCTVS